MKTGIIQKITAKASALICLLLLTSCWENFSNELMDFNDSTPPVVALTAASVTTSSVTLTWDEPDPVTYSAVRITCSEGANITELTVPKGTHTINIPFNTSTECTVSLTAIYSTGPRSRETLFSAKPDTNLYFIYTPAQLDAVPDNSNYYWIVMADLDLSGYQTGTGWTPIINFSGTFDGNGYTISSLYINNSSGEYQGLFGVMTNATIKNVHIAGCNITGRSFVGGLAGQIGAGCTISDCSVSGIINGTGNNIGGFTGQNIGQINNCSASVNVSFEGNVVTNTGGFVGLSQGEISDSFASGTVSLTFTGDDEVERKAGGFCGRTDTGSIIVSCSASGNVYGNLAGSLGGFVAVHASGNINDCFATGNVSGTAGHAGGFLGMTYSSATTDTCFATGNVLITGSKSGETQVGGFSGVCGTATISKCYATGNVTGTTYTGGFTGKCDSNASITRCFATGSVSGTTYAGGFTGYTGNSEGSDSHTITIANCYARGNVSGTNYAGGFSGYTICDNFGTATLTVNITDCYSTGIISGTAGNKTGFGYYTTSGSNTTITVTDCFYNSTTAGGLPDDYAIGKSTSQMKLQATYTGWDFSNVWNIDTKNNGYPYLKDNPPLN